MSELPAQVGVAEVVALGLDAAAGISMPDDAREVIFPNGVPVRMLEASSDDSDAAAGTLAEKERRDKVITAASESGASAVAAEDNLTSEVHDLKRQADAARDPDSGENVLSEPPPPRP